MGLWFCELFCVGLSILDFFCGNKSIEGIEGFRMFLAGCCRKSASLAIGTPLKRSWPTAVQGSEKTAAAPKEVVTEKPRGARLGT